MLGVTIKHNSSLHLVIPVLPSSTFHTLEFKSCPLEYLSVSTYKHGGNSTEFALKRQLLPFCRCLLGQRERGLLQSLITLHNIKLPTSHPSEDARVARRQQNRAAQDWAVGRKILDRASKSVTSCNVDSPETKWCDSFSQSKGGKL